MLITIILSEEKVQIIASTKDEVGHVTLHRSPSLASNLFALCLQGFCTPTFSSDVRPCPPRLSKSRKFHSQEREINRLLSLYAEENQSIKDYDICRSRSDWRMKAIRCYYQIGMSLWLDGCMIRKIQKPAIGIFQKCW